MRAPSAPSRCFGVRRLAVMPVRVTATIATSPFPRPRLPGYIRVHLLASGVAMRVLIPAVVLFAAAGCAGGPGLPPLPNERVVAGFPKGGLADAIAIDAVDPLPLRSAELIAPDGKAAPADWLNVDATPHFAARQPVGNDPYAGNVFGVGNVNAGPPLPVAVGGATETRGQLLAVVSSATIPLSDPVAYRRDWRHYQIRLVFGGPAGPLSRREIPAPAPPPPATPPPS